MRAKTMRCAVAAALLAAGAAQAGEIVIYKQPNFTGAALTINKDDENLTNEGFLDQASSVEIKSGRWELCSQPRYQGDCMILERGRYATLDPKLNHRVESVREVTQVARNEPRERRFDDRRDNDRYADVRRDGRDWRDERDGRDGRDGRWGRRDPASIELFGGQSFRGRGVLLERDAAELLDLDGRVSSVIVHEGTWQVCTAPGFEGFCRTLEPGRYSTLGRMDNRIGSVRRVG